MGPFVTTSWTLSRLPHLSELLGGAVAHRWSWQGAGDARAVLAWGRKPSADIAARYAARHGLPLYRLEDGFLRSVELGGREPPLSVVLDDQGIYYDAGTTSRLEGLIAGTLSPEQAARAKSIVMLWREARVSKYNHLREADPRHGRYVLVADQTFGDASIRFGMAEPQGFQRMLQAALDENPGCKVLLKVHPDVMAGKKRGHFDLEAVARLARVEVLGQDVHPVGLIERAEAVYVVTSQLGFEGLLWDKPVRTFGMPFYAGWGLTRDELPAPARRQPVTLEQLVHAALVAYPRYVDPETGQRCEVERIIEWMGLQRRMRERFPAEVYGLGFSLWKKPMVRAFFQGSAVHFVTSAADVPAGAPLALWGRRPLPAGAPDDVQPVRLEDGFLRSVGLGADLVRPVSWVMDRRGIYYDATRPSDLEHLLQTHVFDEAMRARAARLREAIVAHGLTKYNVGAGAWIRPEWRGEVGVSSPHPVALPEGEGRHGFGSVGHVGAQRLRDTATAECQVGTMRQPDLPEQGRRVILVPGQVENDASIHYGAAELRTNLGLLQAVRRANPDAWVVYKPHPDVLAGLRRAGVDEDEAVRWCDEIVEDVPMQVMLDAVDEVHVLTSLAGFEALLRGREVTCYGNPFYAGWGLTRDMAPIARRTRHLSLDELVAGVLILYPAYVSRTTGRFTTPERALEELLVWREQGMDMPLWRKGLRWVLRMLKLNG
ncbi:MAG: capsular polysaccharide biosynthesis protein [Thiohalomonadaceae bacterium]